MSANPEEIQYESVYREKLLRVPGGCEPAHLSLALPRRLMRDLRSVVLVLPSAVHHGPKDGTVSRRVAAQLVRDETARRSALSFQHLAKEAHSCSAVAARLDQDVEEVAVLVYGPPQIMPAAVDRYAATQDTRLSDAGRYTRGNRCIDRLNASDKAGPIVTVLRYAVAERSMPTWLRASGGQRNWDGCDVTFCGVFLPLPRVRWPLAHPLVPWTRRAG